MSKLAHLTLDSMLIYLSAIIVENSKIILLITEPEPEPECMISLCNVHSIYYALLDLL